MSHLIIIIISLNTVSLEDLLDNKHIREEESNPSTPKRQKSILSQKLKSESQCQPCSLGGHPLEEEEERRRDGKGCGEVGEQQWEQGEVPDEVLHRAHLQ